MQRVENYEYELPSDFEDEEIDEDAAFTEADKEQFADWFGDAGAGGHHMPFITWSLQAKAHIISC